jgi:tellurite resistance protein
MRFLENLVSDMIKDSTGINPRRLVRKISGGKMLLAGGAALAGALIAEQMSKRGGTAGASAAGASTTGAPPPLPPLPGSTPASAEPSAPLPPLPPLPTVSGSATAPSAAEPQESPEGPELPPPVLFAVVRTMAAAALADGELTAEEREAIEGRLGDSGLAEEQIRRIHKDLVLPPGAQELAAMAGDLGLPDDAAAQTRETLYRAAAVVLRADRHVSDRERAWLNGLAEALGLAPQREEELTREVFG